jgi:hypothetical protein
MRARSNDTDSRLSRKDIEALEGQEVANAKEGMTYIESTLLKVPGTPCNAPVANISSDRIRISA